MNPYVKSYLASTALAHRDLVKFTADGVVGLATAATDDIVGVVDYPSGAAIGARADIVRFGPAEVVAAGALTAGGFITANAAGKAVAPAPAAGVNNSVIAVAEVSAVANDIVKVFVQRGRIQG